METIVKNHMDQCINMTETIESLEAECKCHSHELVKLADLLEGAEGSFRTQVARDYKTTANAYFNAKKKLDRLKGNLVVPLK
jgi:hypothetical protein